MWKVWGEILQGTGGQEQHARGISPSKDSPSQTLQPIVHPCNKRDTNRQKKKNKNYNKGEA
jgi:hypothetical protein